MSAFDAVDGASSATSKCYRLVASKPERFKEVRPGNETAFGVLKELARTRRRNADKVVARIGRTRVGQRTLKCVVLIGTRSAHSIRASGLTAAQTGRTHDRTRPMLHRRQKVLAKAPSTHDSKRTSRQRCRVSAFGTSRHCGIKNNGFKKAKGNFGSGMGGRFFCPEDFQAPTWPLPRAAVAHARKV